MNETPSEIFQSALAFAKVDLEMVPETTRSIFGQQIRLMDSAGRWTEDIRIEHVGYTHKRIPWRKRFVRFDYLEWMLRRFLVDRIELSVDFQPFKELASLIAGLEIASENAEDVASEIFSFLKNAMPLLVIQKREACVTAVRSFYRWAIDEGLPGFDEHEMEVLQGIGPSRYSAVSPIVALRDPTQGPYTAAEMRLLNRAVQTSSALSDRQRGLFLLCRDWGVRPIQISLLRPEDLGEDEIGPFVMVPSVKGIRRSRLRRASSNMVRRHLAEDTAEALRRQADAAPGQCARVHDRIKVFMAEYGLTTQPPVALFPCKDRKEARLERFCGDPAIYEYAFHSDSTTISTEMKEIGETLAIPASRSDARQPHERVMYLSSYRLRRTKGTSLVLAGHTADEVAEALDHNGVESISHYFRYSRDLHRFINETAANSSEIVNAIQGWEGRLHRGCSAKQETSAVKVGSLGICTLGKPCPHHPTVSCYACNAFHPDLDADHESALQSIEQYRSQLNSEATGALKGQLDGEVSGAISLIRVINNLKQRVKE